MDPDEVADYLRVPVTTLKCWRLERVGPPSFHLGRHVRYVADDVRRWVGAQRQAAIAATGYA